MAPVFLTGFWSIGSSASADQLPDAPLSGLVESFIPWTGVGMLLITRRAPSGSPLAMKTESRVRQATSTGSILSRSSLSISQIPSRFRPSTVAAPSRSRMALRGITSTCSMVLPVISTVT